MEENKTETMTITFFDSLGRTIIGTVVNENDNILTIKNPAVLHAGLNNEGKIQVNLIPVFFREFLKDWNDPIVFSYNKNGITRDENNMVLDDKLLAQYHSMWTPRPPREVVRAKNNATVRELAPSVSANNDTVEPTKLNLFKEVKS